MRTAGLPIRKSTMIMSKTARFTYRNGFYVMQKYLSSLFGRVKTTTSTTQKNRDNTSTTQKSKSGGRPTQGVSVLGRHSTFKHGKGRRARGLCYVESKQFRLTLSNSKKEYGQNSEPHLRRNAQLQINSVRPPPVQTDS